jgi:hypothetical protein
MLRNIFAVISGLFAMMIIVTFMQLANIKLFYPPPPGLDFTDPETVAAYAQTMPWPALAIVLASWLLAAFVGGAVAARVAGSYRTACALVIGAVDVALIGMNAISIPHPTWMLAAGLLLPIPLAWLAAWLVQNGFASTR